MNLNSEISTYVSTALQSPKVAANVGIGTILAAAFRDLIDGIVAYLGTSAMAIGALLSLVLIYNNIKGGISKRRLEKIQFELAVKENRKLDLEIKGLKKWAY